MRNSDHMSAIRCLVLMALLAFGIGCSSALSDPTCEDRELVGLTFDEARKNLGHLGPTAIHGDTTYIDYPDAGVSLVLKKGIVVEVRRIGLHDPPP